MTRSNASGKLGKKNIFSVGKGASNLSASRPSPQSTLKHPNLQQIFSLLEPLQCLIARSDGRRNGVCGALNYHSDRP